MKTLISVGLVSLLVVVSFAVAEDEDAGSQAAVVAQCEKALAAARTQDWDAVIAACHKAIDEAQKIKQGSMVVAFPDAPQGWRAGEIEKQRTSMGVGGEAFSGIHVGREYTHAASGVVVKTTVSDWPVFQAQYKGLLAMKEHPPQMLEMMGISFFDKAGAKCMKVAPQDGDDVTILAFGEKAMLWLECPKKDVAKAQAIFDLFDLKKVLASK